MDWREVAWHEYGHVAGAEDGGLAWWGLNISPRGHGSGVWIAHPQNASEVAASQVADMCGQAAAEKYGRESGRWWVGDGAGGDRENFVEVSRLPGAISMGEAKRRARAVIERNGARIAARVERWGREHGMVRDDEMEAAR